MKTPEAVKIMGITYQIQEVPVISKDEWRLGEIDHINQVIKLDSQLLDQAKSVALLHEIIHGALFALGLAGEHNDEMLVQGLASALYQVFEDNALF